METYYSEEQLESMLRAVEEGLETLETSVVLFPSDSRVKSILEQMERREKDLKRRLEWVKNCKN